MAESDDDQALPFCGSVADIGGQAAWDAENLIAPYYPSTHEKVHAILQSISFSADDVLYDLGCGDGRVLFEAVACGCPRAVGVELDDELASLIRLKAAELSAPVHAITGDLLTVDFSEATVLYLYLLPKALGQIQAKVEQLMTEGRLRLVVTNTFDFPSMSMPRKKDEMQKFITYTPRTNLHS